METTDAKAELRQNVRDVLGEFHTGHIELEATVTYLLDLIGAGDPAQYEHPIHLRAHD